MSIIMDESLTDQQRAELIRNRIAWIDEHEKMFEITSLMHLERQLLKEELEAIDGGEHE